MTIKYYLFAVSFYVIGGSCLYFVGKKLLSQSSDKKTIKRLFPVLCLGLTLAGVILVNYTFYCQSYDIKVTNYLLCPK
jgi:hypothetical protein